MKSRSCLIRLALSSRYAASCRGFQVAYCSLTTTRSAQIASGSNHTLALTAKGKVLAWGDSQQGQVRYSTVSVMTRQQHLTDW